MVSPVLIWLGKLRKQILLDKDCARWSAGTAWTMFDCHDITIIQLYRSDLLKLEAIMSDNNPELLPTINKYMLKIGFIWFPHHPSFPPALASWRAGHAKI